MAAESTLFLKNPGKYFVRQLAANDDFPAMNLHTLDDRKISLPASGHTKTLVAFWTSLWDWAPQFNEKLNKLAADYPYAKLEIVGVNLDESPRQLERFLAAHPARWTQCFLGEKASPDLQKKYGFVWPPAIYLVGSDGKVIASVGCDNVDADVAKLMAR
jgi:hypothetical protein